MSAPRLLELKIPPGVVKTRSGEGAEGRWVDALNVEFINGKPQKRAGHEALNTTLMDGVARGMRAWTALDSGQLYMVGTSEALYGSTDGIEPIVITPRIHPITGTDILSATTGSGALVIDISLASTGVQTNNPLTTTSGSPIVTVASTAHGLVNGDIADVDGASAVGGITPDGRYVVSVVNANSYTIRHGSNASSAVTGGGLVSRTSTNARARVGAPLRLYVSPLQIVGGLVRGENWIIIGAADTNSLTIFPADDTGTLSSNPFTATSGSATVSVNHPDHGKAESDVVAYVGATAFAGLQIAGEYVISNVGEDNYDITAAFTATSSASGGGAGVAYYWGTKATITEAAAGGLIGYNLRQLNGINVIGSSTTAVIDIDGTVVAPGDYVIISEASLVGGGIDVNGRHLIDPFDDVVLANIVTSDNPTFNTTENDVGGSYWLEFETAPRAVSAVPGVSEAGYWSLDRIGEDGIASYLNGPVYYWDSSEGGRADIIPNAPTKVRFTFMSDERMLHCLGINDDPLVMGWSDQDDINNWTDASTTTANTSRRVQDGSMLIAGTPVGGGMNLIWTDTAVIRHQYTGSRFIYDTKTDKTNAGLIGPHAFCRTPSGVFWISSSKFKMWNGFTQDVPNALDVEDWFFRQMNRDQQAKCFAVYNPVKNSIDFHQVITGETEPTVYVTVNLADFSWVNGIESRTAGAAFSAGSQNPVKVQSGQIYKHEIGLNDNGSAMNTYLTMAPLEAAKGAWVEITGLDPDMKRQVGNVVLTLDTYDRYPGAIVDTEVATIAVSDEMTDLRSSGRHFGMTFSQEVLDGDWAIDTPDVELRVAGKRR